jgi:Lecithin retinol acyltransferase
VNPVVDVAAVVIGTQLIVCRLEYYRRGIYVGNGRVVHHTGRIRYPHGLIEEVSLADFVAGRPVRLGDTPCQSSACGVVRRARCRLGEQRYDLLQNNCEHFCTWCQTGRPRSPQVDALRHWQRLIARAIESIVVLIVPWLRHPGTGTRSVWPPSAIALLVPSFVRPLQAVPHRHQ